MMLTPIPITLEYKEFRLAAEVGIQRQSEFIKDKQEPRPGTYGIKVDDAGWSQHIEGAAGEMALAKHLGMYWNGIPTEGGGDVGPYEVRTTPYPEGPLRLHKKDADDSKFVLVTGRALHFKLVGWIYARDGKKDEYWGNPWKNGRPAFWVPHSDLHPMSELTRDEISAAAKAAAKIIST